MSGIYCVKCKRRTETRSPHIVSARNGRKRIVGQCGTCGTKKSKFVSSKVADGSGVRLPGRGVRLPGRGVRLPGNRFPFRGGNALSKIGKAMPFLASALAARSAVGDIKNGRW
jgi:hypothetical protein